MLIHDRMRKQNGQMKVGLFKSSMHIQLHIEGGGWELNQSHGSLLIQPCVEPAVATRSLTATNIIHTAKRRYKESITMSMLPFIYMLTDMGVLD